MFESRINEVITKHSIQGSKEMLYNDLKSNNSEYFNTFQKRYIMGSRNQSIPLDEEKTEIGIHLLYKAQLLAKTHTIKKKELDMLTRAIYIDIIRILHEQGQWVLFTGVEMDYLTMSNIKYNTNYKFTISLPAIWNKLFEKVRSYLQVSHVNHTEMFQTIHDCLKLFPANQVQFHPRKRKLGE